MLVGLDAGPALVLAADAIEGIGLVLLYVLAAASGVAWIVGTWGVLVKAGRPGWQELIPIYNVHALVRVAGKALAGSCCG